MSPFIEELSRLLNLASTPATLVMFACGLLIYVIPQWHVRLLSFMTQVFFLGLIFLRLFVNSPELAILKLLVGWIIGGALYFSARVREDSLRRRLTTGEKALIPFRLVTGGVLFALAYLAARTFPLPFIPEDLVFTCYALLVLGVLLIGTEHDAVLVGLGMLNVVAALDVFYAAYDPVLLITGLLIFINLIIGLVISYLTVSEVAV